MSRDYYRYEDAYGFRPRKANLFGWTILILLLMGIAFAAWLGSFYVFGQPERPESYRILQRLHKIEPTKRFELTAAPPGEFLNSHQLYDRFSALHPSELAKANAELMRNFIRNFQQVRGLVPYVVGRFQIIGARELGPDDIFQSGMVVLAAATDQGELLMEHIYPADPPAIPLMARTLEPTVEIKLERTHDISAVIHADRLADGRILITTIPLLYGTYTATKGTGTFSLEPPLVLNLAASWPIFKDGERLKAERRFSEYRANVATVAPNAAIAGISPPPTQPANQIVRVEQAQPLNTPKPTATPPPPPAKPTPKNGRLARNQKPGATPPLISVWTPTPGPVATPPPVPSDVTVASTAGGGIWKTFPPGKMPAGRLIGTSDLEDVADHGLAGETVYLKGQFVVNFTEPNRAVLRPKGNLTDTVLHFGRGDSSTRVIVEYPSGCKPPPPGTVLLRDEARPYEITEVRKQADGQFNVFVREIMQ